MDRLELIQVDVNYNYSERLEGERSKTNIYQSIYLQECFFVCWRVAGVFATNISLLLCGMIW